MLAGRRTGSALDDDEIDSDINAIMLGMSPNLHHRPRQPLESSSGGSGPLSLGVRVALAVGSLLALMVLFFSLQESDVSTKNGISRRRLPPEVIGQLGASKGQPLSKYATKEWIESQDRYRDDRPDQNDEDVKKGPGDAADEDYDYEHNIGESPPQASTSSSPPSSRKQVNDKTKDKKKNKGKKGNEKGNTEETCDVNPAPPGVYVKGHGPCITQFPHQPAAFGGMDDCWRLAFAVAQWKQPKNPLKAEYGDDWEATAKAYPHTAKQAQQIVEDFNRKTELPISEEWRADHPYVRLCVPTACGLSKASGCELRETDFLMHINPNTMETDNTTHLFYKGFVRDGHLMLPNAGLTGH